MDKDINGQLGKFEALCVSRAAVGRGSLPECHQGPDCGRCSSWRWNCCLDMNMSVAVPPHPHKPLQLLHPGATLTCKETATQTPPDYFSITQIIMQITLHTVNNNYTDSTLGMKSRPSVTEIVTCVWVKNNKSIQSGWSDGWTNLKMTRVDKLQ